MCYSESIEAVMVATLRENKSPLITSLVCGCIEKWVAVRGYCQLFVEDVVLNLCIIGHRCVQVLCVCEQLKVSGAHEEKSRSVLLLRV